MMNHPLDRCRLRTRRLADIQAEVSAATADLQELCQPFQGEAVVEDERAIGKSTEKGIQGPGIGSSTEEPQKGAHDRIMPNPDHKL